MISPPDSFILGRSSTDVAATSDDQEDPTGWPPRGKSKRNPEIREVFTDDGTTFRSGEEVREGGNGVKVSSILYEGSGSRTLDDQTALPKKPSCGSRLGSETAAGMRDRSDEVEETFSNLCQCEGLRVDVPRNCPVHRNGTGCNGPGRKPSKSTDNKMSKRDSAKEVTIVGRDTVFSLERMHLAQIVESGEYKFSRDSWKGPVKRTEVPHEITGEVVEQLFVMKRSGETHRGTA